MSMMDSNVTDHHKQPLVVGDHVKGWFDDVPYTGTVMNIEREYPGSGYRHITVLRDDTHAPHQTFSDSVIVQ
jgi:hypothetical protein